MRGRERKGKVLMMGEAGDRFNWGCLLAILASLLVWAIIAMLVLFLL